MNKEPWAHLTKIVATVSNSDPEFLRELYHRGMDVVRLNTAHMKVENLGAMVAAVREVSPYLAVMVDTKGPNIRTSNIPDGGISLKSGMSVRISGIEKDDGRICVNYAKFVDEVPIASRILCDDGAVEFKVTGKQDDCLVAEVLFDTVVYNHKSVNVPDVSLNAPSLSGKDKDFLHEAAKLQCDFVAHSFVRNADDIKAVRAELGESSKDIKIIAKIENREGVNNIHEILKEADGIMVARGDLGIEIPLEEVPGIQKKLIYEARLACKPVITATQMLQSMMDSPLPTRAEVSDVANAVYDGTDAVMLSGETAHGHYPFEAVDTMCRIVIEAESSPKQFFTDLNMPEIINDEANYLLAAAVRTPSFLPIKLIVCSTLSGRSARFCSAFRPKVHIYAPTPNESVMRQLSLSYGVRSALVSFAKSPTEQAMEVLNSLMKKQDKIKKDDKIVVLGKITPEVNYNNLLGITTIKELEEAE